MTTVYNPEERPEYQYPILAERTVRLEDNGMQYDAVLFRVGNSLRNLNNGATATEMVFRKVWKIKKNGERGMELSGRNVRLWDIARNLTV